MVSMSENLQHEQPVSPEPAIDPEAAWRQLIGHDPAAKFFYAVSTTGVFCRPGCASRRPLRAHVRFFASAEAARAAGFRPCRRCRPEDAARGIPVEKLREHIEAHLDRPVPLAELGRLANRSAFTVQRLFKRAFGVSPLQYQRALRSASLRKALKQGDTVTNAMYNAGFGSSSRGYDGAPLGMTPARFARGGEGERIGFAIAHSPFGWMVVGATARGLCWLALAGTKAEAEGSLRAEFPLAALKRDPALAGWVETAVAMVGGAANPCEKLAPPQVEKLASPQVETLAPPQVAQVAQELDLRGTVFQLRVWQALRQIPRGQTRSYSQLARELGNPNATRAVARACAMNRVALLVPCHRVVGAAGALTGYRWGIERKRQLLEAEAAPTNAR
jgi:AraC family transcriptional regulator of adaptative response/methylated-DNA-[protein]-cysteine methyltransferase